MLSGKAHVTGGLALDYFDHEKGYYTEHLTNQDRWHGALAQAMRLEGEVSLEQFEAAFDLKNNMDKDVAFDLTFSCPKSVSLARAYNQETQEAIDRAIDKALKETLDYIEAEYIKTRVTENGITRSVHTNNMLAASFRHHVARPSEYNDFKSDLDEHIHCVINRKTIYNNKIMSIDDGVFFDKHKRGEIIKKCGLYFRGRLAVAMQEENFNIDVTNKKQGYWELRGFPREFILENSHRRQEVLDKAETEGISKNAAVHHDRAKKSQTKGTLEEMQEHVRKRMREEKIFETEWRNEYAKQAEIERKADERIYTDKDWSRFPTEEMERIAKRATQWARDHETGRIEPDCRNVTSSEGRKYALSEPFDRLYRLREFNNHETGSQSIDFLRENELDRLERGSKIGARNTFMLRSFAVDIRGADRGERIRQIDEVTRSTIKELMRNDFAVTVPKAMNEIQSAGVKLGITDIEAKQAIERCDLVVNLGRRIKTNGKDQKEYTPDEVKRYNFAKAIKMANGTWIPEKDITASGDIYITTKESIETEQYIIDAVKNGKNVINDRVLTFEKSWELLLKVEGKINAELEAKGAPPDAIFSITGIKNGKKIRSDEQAKAVCGLLSNSDRVYVLEGHAGSGKTTACNRLKGMCDAAGIRILGLAQAGQAAANLQAESGIQSSTIHSFLNYVEKHNALPPEGLDLKKWQKEQDKKSGGGGKDAPERADEKRVSVSKAVKENIAEAFNDGRKVHLDKVPKRSVWGKIKRAGKEIAAEAVMDKNNAALVRQRLRAEDVQEYFRQKKEERSMQEQERKSWRGIQERKKEQEKVVLEDEYNEQGIKQKWDWSKLKPVKERVILNIDEFGQVDNYLSKEIMTVAEKMNLQLFVMGERIQNKSIGAGDALDTIIRNGAEVSKLKEINRQKIKELKEAVEAFINDDTSTRGLKYFKDHNKIFEYETKKSQRAKIVEEALTDNKGNHKTLESYQNHPDPDVRGMNLILTTTNAERKVLNRMIRERYIEAGELERGREFTITDRTEGDKKPHAEKRNFSKGDRIIFKQNDNKLDVKNGMLGSIQEINGNKFKISLDGPEGTDRRIVEFDIRFYNDIDHSYCVTQFTSQGMTVQKVVGDLNTKSAVQNRNVIYVEMSRAKREAIIVTDDIDELERQTKNFAHKLTTADFQSRIDELKENGITDKDRYFAKVNEAQKIEEVNARIEKHMRKGEKVVKEKTPDEKIAAITEKSKSMPIGRQEIFPQISKTLEKTDMSEQEKLAVWNKTVEAEHPELIIERNKKTGKYHSTRDMDTTHRSYATVQEAIRGQESGLPLIEAKKLNIAINSEVETHIQNIMATQERALGKAQDAHDRMVGQMPVGAGVSLSRPTGGDVRNLTAGTIKQGSSLNIRGGSEGLGMGGGGVVGTTGKAMKAVGQAIQAAGDLAGAVPVIGTPIKAASKVVGKPIEVAGKVTETVGKVADPVINVGKSAVKEGVSKAMDAAQKGEESGKKHHKPVQPPVQVQVRHIPYPNERRETYEHEK